VKTANIKEIPAERELFCSFGGAAGAIQYTPFIAKFTGLL
jgi:hypothetical protein